MIIAAEIDDIEKLRGGEPFFTCSVELRSSEAGAGVASETGNGAANKVETGSRVGAGNGVGVDTRDVGG